MCRNDDYLLSAGIPISPSIDFLFTEPVPGLEDEDEAGPDASHDSEFASDDPQELPPPPAELLEAKEGREGSFAPR